LLTSPLFSEETHKTYQSQYDKSHIILSQKQLLTSPLFSEETGQVRTVNVRFCLFLRFFDWIVGMIISLPFLNGYTVVLCIVGGITLQR
jgi:hypothetical protein